MTFSINTEQYAITRIIRTQTSTKVFATQTSHTYEPRLAWRADISITFNRDHTTARFLSWNTSCDLAPKFHRSVLLAAAQFERNTDQTNHNTQRVLDKGANA